jgi:hypothetical protein
MEEMPGIILLWSILSKTSRLFHSFPRISCLSLIFQHKKSYFFRLLIYFNGILSHSIFFAFQLAYAVHQKYSFIFL